MAGIAEVTIKFDTKDVRKLLNKVNALEKQIPWELKEMIDLREHVKIMLKNAKAS